jgi:hypothetical protein
MDTLRVDTALLRAVGVQLRVVAEEFRWANANSDDAAEVVGHRGLAEAVRSFARNWDDRRARVVEEIGALAMSASAVGEAFEGLDKEFAAALRGEK